MDLSTKKIIIGGWPAFAEQAGVNKKEPFENFDWMDSYSMSAYNDCNQAMNRFEGSREWLKNYTSEKRCLPFNCAMGHNISGAMNTGHSGASFSLLMWHYKYALNNWDIFVFNSKQYEGRREFKRQQVPMWKVNHILWDCENWLKEDGVSEKAKALEVTIFTECTRLCLSGLSIPEIKAVLLIILADLEAIEAEDKRQREEEGHRSLMGCLEFLYEHPIRWFDGPSGCALKPVHPNRITKRAMEEMEIKFPGYNNHIERVLQAMSSSCRPQTSNFDAKGQKMWEDFLREQEIIAVVEPIPVDVAASIQCE